MDSEGPTSLKCQECPKAFLNKIYCQKKKLIFTYGFVKNKEGYFKYRFEFAPRNPSAAAKQYNQLMDLFRNSGSTAHLDCKVSKLTIPLHKACRTDHLVSMVPKNADMRIWSTQAL
ncbi:hypothetical protein BX616_002496 [Lobosporangium transversale]|nr:hypothetical protein BX616_002496 [Lobosporangium transversale]